MHNMVVVVTFCVTAVHLVWSGGFPAFSILVLC